MRFLVDEDLPLTLIDVFERYDHEALHVVHAGIRGATDDQVARYARDNEMCLVSGDLDFSDVRTYPPREYKGIVVVRVPRNATTGVIAAIVESFLVREDVVDDLPGKLAIVEPGRARIRRC